MPNATTNNNLSKYVTENPQSVNRPLSKMWEIAIPTPLRIDAPDCCLCGVINDDDNDNLRADIAR